MLPWIPTAPLNSTFMSRLVNILIFRQFEYITVVRLILRVLILNQQQVFLSVTLWQRILTNFFYFSEQPPLRSQSLLLPRRQRPPNNAAMHLNPPIPHDDSESMGELSSDFPPIRVRNSTPDPQALSVASHYFRFSVETYTDNFSFSEQQSLTRKSQSSLLRRQQRLPHKALGHKNILNTVNEKVKVRSKLFQVYFLLNEC